MSQIKPIAFTAPLTENFVPVAHNGNVVVYHDRAQAIPSLRKTLTLSLAVPTKTSKLYKARFRMVVPVEKMDLSGATPVGTGIADYINSFDLTYILDGRSTEASRQDLFNLLSEFLGSSDEASDLAVQLLPLY